MNYLRFTQYAYLIAGLLFAVDTYFVWKKGENAIISGVFAVICIFMFFFRRNFGKKFDDYKKK